MMVISVIVLPIFLQFADRDINTVVCLLGVCPMLLLTLYIQVRPNKAFLATKNGNSELKP